MTGVSAIVLAAGAGSRFGGDKLLALYLGKTLIEATLDGLRESPVDEIIVVVGKKVEELRSVCEPYGVRVLENSDWEDGMSTSVLAGLAVTEPEARAAVVLLADQPLVGSEAVVRLMEAFDAGASVAVATYDGAPRNPVLFARKTWPLLEEELSGDEGARGFIRRHPDLVTGVPCDDVADPVDVDTVEDLGRLEERVAAEATPEQRRRA
ncbi:MAG: nucleotidyltransferase family protein [Rubrobacteraceae bacterium]